MPELIGETAAGRNQRKHPFLYWELRGQVAVRMEHWKAIRPRNNSSWELYDLTADVSETNSVAARYPDVLNKLKSFAEASHTPVESGSFHDRSNHEKDRKAKWGDTRPQRKRGDRTNK